MSDERRDKKSICTISTLGRLNFALAVTKINYFKLKYRAEKSRNLYVL